MKPCINITVEFSYKGNPYHGITLMDGVNLSLVDAPCGSARQLLAFSVPGPTGIFFDAVSAIDDKSTAPIASYLRLKPE